MNITVIRLVIVATSTGFIVVNTHGSRRVFLNARVNSTFLGRDSLPLVLIPRCNDIAGILPNTTLADSYCVLPCSLSPLD